MKSKILKNNTVKYNNIVSFLFKLLLLIQMIILSYSCSDNPTEQKEEPCPPLLIVSNPPYDSPAWHPDGKIIGFNHTPLDSITYPYGEHCAGRQYFNYDSTGFWLINTDGTNMHRVLPYKLQTPAWAPDGKWIAFVKNANIFKMPFNILEEKFDTTQIQQLTFEGRNFFPSWSPDGEWIAFDKSICEGLKTCGVFIMNKNGEDERFISDYSRMPDWHPNGQNIIFINRAVLDGGEEIGDSLWEYDVITNERKLVMQLTGINYDNRYPKYSPLSSKIAFSSQGTGSSRQLWLLDLSKNTIQRLTSKGVYEVFSWSSDGKKIVYSQHNYNKWSYNNGVLWIIDVNTKNEYQLTFN